MIARCCVIGVCLPILLLLPCSLAVAVDDTVVSSPAARDFWAIVVGISEYKNDPSWHLEYADADARGFVELIKKPTGGAFADDHIEDLYNEEATTRAITKALRSFLKKPKQEDVVMIFFSCHGYRDRERPDVFYILTHDTDPKDIAGTALPMREVRHCLEDYLLAERVVIIVDTCYAAAIAGGKSVDAVYDTAHDYLTSVSKAKKGTAFLMSSRATEKSQERGFPGGGGHGVFTGFLLKGMQGDADKPPFEGGEVDGLVTIDELFDYVQREVKTATDGFQTPAIGPDPFDADFPMAITGGRSAKLRFELGSKMLRMGRLLEEKRLFQSCEDHLFQAQRLFAQAAPQKQAEANRLRGLAMMALGDYLAASRALADSIRTDDGRHPDTYFHLAVAHARQGQNEKAIEHLKQFDKLDPANHNTRFAQELRRTLESPSPPSRYALLIGVNNDVQRMEYLLKQRFGFADEQLKTLADKHATRDAVIGCLTQISKEAKWTDSVTVYFSGETRPGINEYFLRLYDNETAELADSLTGEQLHDLLNAIPAATTLVLDADCPNTHSRFLNLVRRDADYAVISACAPGQSAYEIQVPESRESRVGLFTYELVQYLLQDAQADDITNEQLIGQVYDRIFAYELQIPHLFGARGRRFLPNRNLLALYNISQLEAFRNLSGPDLDRSYRRIRRELHELDVPFPDIHARIGRALLDKGHYAAAREALRKADEEAKGDIDFETTMSMAIACLLSDEHLKQAKSLAARLKRRNLSAPQREHNNKSILVDKLSQSIEGLDSCKPYALLVGIDDYADPAISDVAGAMNDLEAMRKLLTEKLAFDVKTLKGPDAERDKIIAEFKTLAVRARHDPAVFYFAGNGSVDRHGLPTLLSVDARQDGVYDIRLGELAVIAGADPGNLVAIIDAGSKLAADKPRRRSVPRDDRRQPVVQPRVPTLQPRVVVRSDLAIGRHSLYPYWFSSSIAGEADFIAEGKMPSLPGEIGPAIHGRLTHAIVSSLWKLDLKDDVTYTTLITRAQNRLSLAPPLLLSKGVHEPVFGNHAVVNEMRTALYKYERRELDDMIANLKELRETRRDLSAECELDLGIAYAAAEDYKQSILSFERSLEFQRTASTVTFPEIYFHLGRVLYGQGDYYDAVARLRKAIERQPENIPAKYYYGQALRALAEADSLAPAEVAFQEYLRAGAPAGHWDEISTFLNSRRTARYLTRGDINDSQ